MTTSKHYSPRHPETKEKLFLHEEMYPTYKENGDYKTHETRTYIDTVEDGYSEPISGEYYSLDAIHNTMAYHSISTDQYVICEVTVTYGIEVKELT